MNHAIAMLKWGHNFVVELLYYYISISMWIECVIQYTRYPHVRCCLLRSLMGVLVDDNHQ